LKQKTRLAAFDKSPSRYCGGLRDWTSIHICAISSFVASAPPLATLCSVGEIGWENWDTFFGCVCRAVLWRNVLDRDCYSLDTAGKACQCCRSATEEVDSISLRSRQDCMRARWERRKQPVNLHSEWCWCREGRGDSSFVDDGDVLVQSFVTLYVELRDLVGVAFALRICAEVFVCGVIRVGIRDPGCLHGTSGGSSVCGTALRCVALRRVAPGRAVSLLKVWRGGRR
jgi:hypothetical protein